jgi:hypothetical protein
VAAEAAEACERAFSPLLLHTLRSRAASPSRSLLGELGGPASPEAWLHAEASALAHLQARVRCLLRASIQRAFLNERVCVCASLWPVR